MRSMFSGSAIIAVALLSSSLLLTASQSTAETLLSGAQQPHSEVQQPSPAAPAQQPEDSQTPAPAQEHQPAQPASPAQSAQPEQAEQPAKPPQPEQPAQPAQPSQPKAPQPEGLSATACFSSPADYSPKTSGPSLNSGDSNPTGVTSTGLAPATHYVATAYSLRGRTASGKIVSRGFIAADPSVLPLGSRVRLEAASYTGEYLVADTGGAVRGRRIDIWTPSSREARRFGRRTVKLTVLCYGPKRSAHRKRVRA
jgi:3D (Asp-Asp-Asp) domain-containing protein